MSLRMLLLIGSLPVATLVSAYVLRIAVRWASGFWMKYWKAYTVSLVVFIAASIFSWISKAVTVMLLFSDVANKLGYRYDNLDQKTTLVYGLTWLLTEVFASSLLGVLIVNPIDERRIGIIGGLLTVFFYHLVFILFGIAILVPAVFISGGSIFEFPFEFP